jgi:hypothetical protein
MQRSADEQYIRFSFLIPTQHLLNVLIQIANKKGIKKYFPPAVVILK